MLSIAEELHRGLERFTPAERRAARALLANYPIGGLGTVAEFADLAGTSAPTILRFIGRLGFPSYGDFQKQLRQEIADQIKTPLEKAEQRPADAGAAGQGMAGFLTKIGANIAETVDTIPEAEFAAACREIADVRRRLHLIGGRFTDALAHYMAAHLQILRPNVSRFGGQVANWRDQLLDIDGRDVFVFFDIRRYQDDLLGIAAEAARRKARIILITDQWLSPIARHAVRVLPCRVNVHATWDSCVALMAVVEAIVNRVTELTWPTARRRIATLEAMGAGGLRGGAEPPAAHGGDGG